LTISAFCKLQKNSDAKCIRCQISFEENSIVATSASNHRYCYKCASQINLVSGNMNKDLQLDVSLNDAIHHIKKLSKKIQLNELIASLSVKIIEESFKSSLIPSKNILGLACAAIYFAVILLKETLDNITEQLPVTYRVIQRNFSTLRYILMNSKLLEEFNGT